MALEVAWEQRRESSSSSAAVWRISPATNNSTAEEAMGNFSHRVAQTAMSSSAAKRLKATDEHTEAAQISNFSALASELHKKVREPCSVSPRCLVSLCDRGRSWFGATAVH